MIIDAHAHVWVLQPEKYPWSPIGGYIPKTEASIENLLEIMAASGVDGAVLVQPTPYGWNNRYLLDATKKAPDNLRTIALVDPFSQDNKIEMQRLVELEGVNGFRLNWNLQPLPQWELSSTHLSFWKTSQELNRTISIQCSLEYIPLLVSLCRRFPQVRVIVDHLARLNTSAGITNTNFRQLLSLAQEQNTFIKISGFYYCSQESPPYSDVMPYIQAVLDAYGAQRCLWGSDFPFIQEHWGYKNMLDFIKHLVSGTDDDLQWLLGNTARTLWW